MKKVIAILIVFLLVLTTAFADTVNDPNLQPVPDSSVQSSNWSQYIPAEGEGVSGASIMQDNSSDNTLTRKWVYEGGYTSVSETYPVASTVWVQSTTYVPPVTHQQEIMLNKDALVHVGSWDLSNYYLEINGNNFYTNDALYNAPVRIFESIGYDYTGSPYVNYTTVLFKNIQFISSNAISIVQTYRDGLQVKVVDTSNLTGLHLLPDKLMPVKIHTGQYTTIVDQPGYYKDTSHWETTVTYETKQDMVYTTSPHWTDYESIIPQYQLQN